MFPMGPSNSQDVEKKISFLGSQRAGDTAVPGLESLAQDVDTVKYDIGELKETHARVARCCLSGLFQVIFCHAFAL